MIFLEGPWLEEDGRQDRLAGVSINDRGMCGNTYVSDGWRSGDGGWSLSIKTANAVQTEVHCCEAISLTEGELKMSNSISLWPRICCLGNNNLHPKALGDVQRHFAYILEID